MQYTFTLLVSEKSKIIQKFFEYYLPAWLVKFDKVAESHRPSTEKRKKVWTCFLSWQDKSLKNASYICQINFWNMKNNV